MHIDIKTYDYRGFQIVGNDHMGYQVKAGPVKMGEFADVTRAVQWIERSERRNHSEATDN